ncbi:uncharacterized protein [Lolium perenne]|uniref:uncharacterized protein n=1 Tax=Lolium perenne TaxID=4522 RepID=UPI003A994978
MLLDAVLLLPPHLAAAAAVEGGAFPPSSVSIFRSAPQQVKVNRARCLPQRSCPPRHASMRCTYTALPTTGRRAKYNHSTSSGSSQTNLSELCTITPHFPATPVSEY